MKLAPWPAVVAYHAGLLERPSVARAFAEERMLYARELGRKDAPAKVEAAAT